MIIKPTRKFAAKEIKTLGPPHTDWQISNGKITVCHYSLSMVNPIWGDKAGDSRNSDSSHHYHPLQIVEFRLISIKHIITKRLYHPIDEQQWKILDIQIFKSRIRRFFAFKSVEEWNKRNEKQIIKVLFLFGLIDFLFSLKLLGFSFRLRREFKLSELVVQVFVIGSIFFIIFLLL